MAHSTRVLAADTVERFIIPGKDGYSEFWRRDKSPIEPRELAKVLLAVRKIASFVGRNVGNIVWSGMDVEGAIALDPTPILGHYPVPAAKTDVVVGLAIQEALRRTQWSDRVLEAARAVVAVPPQYEYKFDLFARLCEDVYVDGIANLSVLGCYAEAARKWRIDRNAKELISPPTVSELMHIWWKLAADRDPECFRRGYTDRSVGGLVERGTLDKFYKAPIDLLNTLVEPLRGEIPAIPGIAERASARAQRYAALWPELLSYVRFWPGDRGDRFLIPDTCEEDQAADDEAKRAVKATIVSYAQLIEHVIPQKNRDFTEQVKGNVVNTEGVVRIEGNDILMPAKDKLDRHLLHRLTLVVRNAAQRRCIYDRGLRSGKIHGRRLHRAATTGTVFQQRKPHFDLMTDVVLLVDATGSMADPVKWQKCELVYQTLYAAIRPFSRNARIFAYNEVKDRCRISELWQDGRMMTVLPHGKTASGEAIIATALSTRRSTRRRLIVHITDGASNWGCGVSEAIAYCRRNRLGLVTLGIGCSAAARQSLRSEYGERVIFVDQPERIPQSLRVLLGTARSS